MPGLLIVTLLLFNLALGFVAGLLVARRSLLAGSRPRVTGRTPEAQPPVCGCTHHLALHDPDTGKCHGEQMQRYSVGPSVRHRYVPCQCRRYVGPEPIQSFWVPPIASTEESQ